MKRNLFSIAMVVAAAPAFALPTNAVVVAIAEPSTISLIAAGVIALGLARRKVDKATKS